jgi:hypothetical protein
VDIFVMTLLLALAIAGSIGSLTDGFSRLRLAYFSGISAWAGWLPAASTIAVALLMALQLTGHSPEALSLGRRLTTPEALILLLSTPALLTRAGSLIAAFALLWLTWQFSSGDQAASSPLGVVILIGSLTLVAMLGDRLPWLRSSPFPMAAQRLRNMFVLILSLGAIGIMMTTFTKLQPFAKWSAATLGVVNSPALMAGLLFALTAGWLSVMLGMTRHFSLPVLALPTLFVLSFVTGWPGWLLVIPFSACLALSLTASETLVLRPASMRVRNIVVQG